MACRSRPGRCRSPARSADGDGGIGCTRSLAWWWSWTVGWPCRGASVAGQGPGLARPAVPFSLAQGLVLNASSGCPRSTRDAGDHACSLSAGAPPAIARMTGGSPSPAPGPGHWSPGCCSGAFNGQDRRHGAGPARAGQAVRSPGAVRPARPGPAASSARHDRATADAEPGPDPRDGAGCPRRAGSRPAIRSLSDLLDARPAVTSSRSFSSARR
jgi:hypothetical protein